MKCVYTCVEMNVHKYYVYPYFSTSAADVFDSSDEEVSTLINPKGVLCCSKMVAYVHVVCVAARIVYIVVALVNLSCV